MIDDTRLQVRPKDGDSSLNLSKVRSGLVARGRSDAAMLTAPVGAESEEQRTGLLCFRGFSLDLYDLGRPHDEIRRDAENGDAKQQNTQALLCRFGSGKNLVEAVRWYRKAADQGYAPAQLNLGVMYDSVEGVAQDYAEAAKWYRKAADQGYAPAQFNLGVMYDNGEGMPRDYAEAIRWYRKAADQNVDQAQFNLGMKYHNGQGVAQDYAEAANWFRKAADRGSAKAQFNLGMKYQNGQGVSQDYLQAHMWMGLAAVYANVDDGKRYATARDRVAAKMNGAQIAEAQRLAFRWFRKAADQGDALTAPFNLAVMYANGQGVAQDYLKAHMWMNVAASMAYSDESYATARDRVAAKMNPAQIAEAQRLAREWIKERRG